MTMSATAEGATSVALSGLALAIFATSLSCLCLSALTVGLRIYTRVHDHAFGLDDGLILAGLILYAVDVGLSCYGATVGLGSLNKDINAFLQQEGLKYLMLWMMIYVIGLMTIKSSICVTLLRIASTSNPYRLAIFCLLGLTVATFLVTFIGILLLCHPVSANWTGQGKCAGAGTMVALSYISTAATIVTDLACAVLPGVMLWNLTQMNRSKKRSVMILLSFGSIASVTTMIRAPYIQSYWTPLDNLGYHTGFIVLLSNIESAIGLIACSIPTLRRFLVRRNTKPAISNPTSLVTIGGAGSGGRAKAFRNPTDQGISFATVHASTNHDWTRLRESDRESAEEDGRGSRRIRAEYTYHVEMSTLSATGTSSSGEKVLEGVSGV